MNDLSEHDEDSGGATQAFEDLRAEMSVLRRAVEALPAAWTDNQAPDYRPDLARLNKGLASVTSGLAAIEQHTALRQTLDQHQAAVARAGDTLMRDAAQKLDRATQATEREQRQLATMIGTMEEKHIQRFWLMALPAAAFVFTLLISPIFLSTLPFGLNDMAALIVTGG
jgi:hypothetical protein